MSEMAHDSVPEDDTFLWQGREFVKDSQREIQQPYDSPLQKAARKYLRSRSRRIRIEWEAGSSIDAFPYRLVEVIRACKLEKVGKIEFFSKHERDDFLPTFARFQIDKTPDLPVK